MQQQTLPALLCAAQEYDTLYVRNTGSAPLAISSAPFTGGANYALVAPALPDSIAPGDSLPFVVQFAPTTAGTLAATLNIYSNDTAAGHNPWQVQFTGRKDSVWFVFQHVAADTLDFGELDCSVQEDTNFLLSNFSTIPTTFAMSTGSGAFSVPTSEIINVGVNQTIPITVHFAGGAPGVYIDSLVITDTCGGQKTLFLKATVDSALFAISSFADTAVCPGAAVTRTIAVRNLAPVAQTLALAGGAALYAITPDTLALAAGASQPVTITFQGSPNTGTFSAQFVYTDGCGESHIITATVHVAAPNIAVPQSLSATVCPGAAATFIVPVANRDTIQRVLTFAGTNCTLSQTGATLAAGESDTLSATFPGGNVGPMGVDTCLVTVTDDCGGVHVVTLVVNVRQLPPLALALQPQTGAITINDDAQVFVVASSLAALSSGSNVTFTVTNEPTALAFDSVSSPCGASVVAGNNSVTVTLANCPNLTNDTIAVLYYQTLAGSTLAPEVALANASTTNTCDTVSGAGAATLSLLPPGCELGTIIVEPYTTSLGQIYPNPATGTAVVTYSTIEDAPVRIALADALGRTVQTIVNEYKKHGRYAAPVETSAIRSGVYFVQMNVGRYEGTREMVILK